MYGRTVILTIGLVWGGVAWADTVDDLLAGYQADGATEAFDAARGQTRWGEGVTPAEGGEARSCATCHGTDLTQVGKQVNTGKVIQPMAPSAQADRLQDPAKIEKWFTRNCKWTWGRACTPQEKGDFLSFLRNQ